MIALLCLFLTLFASPFKSKSRLEAENAALRHQLIVLKRRVRGRVQLTNGDRLFLVQLYRWFPIGPQGHHDHPARDPRALASSWLPSVLALEIPLSWRPTEDRRGAARADPADECGKSVVGAPLIHGELLKLGFEVAQSSVAKYMVQRCEPPSQGWRTFLRNHAPDIAAMDLFVAPTIGFDLLYVLVIIRLERRNLVWINVTPHPSAE